MALAFSCAVRTVTKLLGAAFVWSGVFFSGPITADAGELLKMQVSPRVTQAPADIFIYIRLEPRPENRLLLVTADSSEFFRSSEVQLEGESSPRVTVFRFRQLPPGSYNIAAELIGSNGKTRERVRFEVTVL